MKARPRDDTHEAIRRAERAKIRSELVTLAMGLLSLPAFIFAAWLYVMSL